MQSNKILEFQIRKMIQIFNFILWFAKFEKPPAFCNCIHYIFILLSLNPQCGVTMHCLVLAEFSATSNCIGLEYFDFEN